MIMKVTFSNYACNINVQHTNKSFLGTKSWHK
jgi:hypothetical protein